MKKYNIIFLLLWGALLFFNSCENETYNEHYQRAYSAQTDGPISEYIKNSSELSTFYEMIVQSGFDKVLSSSQTYTIWVPENAALTDFDTTNDIDVERLVKNHLARFVYNTTSEEVDKVRVMSQKLVNFVGGSTPTFGNASIKESILTKNGVIYIIDDYIPFRPNIFEYLGDTKGLDSLYTYVVGQTEVFFDSINSTVIGQDPETEKPIYDSILIEYNWVFNMYGDINDEDSIYTALLLDNQAWSLAYDSIKPYFKSFRDDSIEIQEYYTQRTIVKDLIYRGELTDISMYDSLISTSGTVFHNPNKIFEGAKQTLVSNGLVYETSNYNINSSISFLKEIRIEAENKNVIRNNDNCTLKSVRNYSDSLTVSNNEYVIVEPTTTSNLSKVRVDFEIPGTLSTEYNIYVQFVPTSLQDTTDHRPFKPLFFMSYKDEDKKEVSILRNRLDVDLEETNPDSLTKVLVAKNFKFPYCDYPWNEEDITTVILRVQNDARTSETANYSREMRIDCVILEPVKQ